MSNNQIYNIALLPAPKRNLLDMSQEHKTTLDAGWLVPINITEMIPGDTFHGQVASKIRTLPMNSPAFQQFDIGWFTAVVPMRLLMNPKKWGKFIAEDDDAEGPAYCDYSTLARLGHHFDSAVEGVESQSLANYLGLPVYTPKDASGNYESCPDDDTPISLAPFMAYQFVYDEWFRDNNLSESKIEDYLLYFGDGGYISEDGLTGDSGALALFDSLTKLQHRAFQKDMFTSALPSTQHGTQVVIPVATASERIPINNISPKFHFQGNTTLIDPVLHPDQWFLFGKSFADQSTINADSVNLVGGWLEDQNDIHFPHMNVDNPPYMSVQVKLGDGTGPYVNLSGLQGIEVNTFRTAMMIQTFLERLEVCGSRYSEVIRGMFGVLTPDARLQRPELIAGWRSNLMIGDVLQTEDPSTSATPAGTLKGIGLGISGGKTFKYHAYEHAYLIQFVSILPKQAYGQGIPRIFTRQNKFDYFWPLLAHQGEEAILNREIFFDPGEKDANEGTFGYQSRYFDYRSNYDRISGELTPGQTLAYWSGSRNFENTPELSMQFVECRYQDSGLSRIFPLEYYPTKNFGFFIGDFYTKLKAWRPVPKFATPASL